MNIKLFDHTIHLLQRSLDLRTSRHKILSGNIANSENPNYLSKDLPFQKVLERSISHAATICIKTTHPDHLSVDFKSEGEAETSEERVNIDQEMAKLAENNLMFQAGVQALVKKLEALKLTIVEGGK